MRLRLIINYILGGSAARESFGKLSAQHAEEFRGNAQVRSDLLLRNPLPELRVFVLEMMVTLHGCSRKALLNASLQGDERVLKQDAEEPLEFRCFRAKTIIVLPGQLQEAGRFDGLYAVK